MKTGNGDFIRSCFETIVLAVIIGFLTVWAAKAESNLNFDVLNGLFTPTQAERFFEVGREKIEREVEILNHPERYLSDDLLEIDPTLIEQMDRNRELPNFGRENAPFQLFLDTNY